MDDQSSKRSGLGKLLWLFVLLAIVLVWWYFRGDKDAGNTEAEQAQDRAAAVTDPDEILVDLKDDATPDQIAAVERDAGIQLTLVDDTAKDSKLYRAHVDPAQRDAIIDKLSKNPEVEIAEPDAQVQLSPGETDES